MDGTKVATGRWHVLFSPDDTIVIVSSVPAGGLSKIAIQVQDLVRRKNIGTVVQANCSACDLQSRSRQRKHRADQAGRGGHRHLPDLLDTRTDTLTAKAPGAPD